MSEKTRNNKTWTEARFVSFVKSALRQASKRWAPINETKRKAKVARGVYMCAGYKREPHLVPVTVVNESGKRVNNVQVDHINPIVGEGGFTTWDDFIENLFCESNNLQLICSSCHKQKGLDEAELRTKNKKDK